MARKNPVGKLAESTLKALKDPKGTAGKVVDQAKGTAALSRTVTDTVGTLVGKAARRTGRRGAAATPAAESERSAPSAPTGSPGTANLRAVPDVEESAQTRPTTSPKKQGDALLETLGADESRDATPTRSTTESAPAAKAAPAKKPAAKKSPAKKAPAKKPAAKSAPAKKSASPADVADVVESAVAEDPSKTAATPAKKAPAAKKGTRSATGSPGDKLPAKKQAAKKAPAKKTSAKKGAAKEETAAEKTGAEKSPARSTGKKAPAAKSTAKKTPPKKAPAKKTQPKTAAEVAAAEGEDVRTQAGTSAASVGSNPSTGETDLTQPGTESTVDPATTKQVAAESARLRKAADDNPE